MSSSVSNTFATIIEWILKIITAGILLWLLSMGLKEFDAATFHKRFATFSSQVNRRLPVMLPSIKAKIDSTFYTNRVFYVDMTLADSLKSSPPILDIHSETRDILASSTGPDDFGKSVVQYKITMTYRFMDKTERPVKNMSVSPTDYWK